MRILGRIRLLLVARAMKVKVLISSKRSSAVVESISGYTA
jgi:hypothetical protein